MTKKEVRTQIQTYKKGLTQEMIHTSSHNICNQFLADDLYHQAKVIFAYIPFNQEIRIHSIIEQAWLDAKPLAVPRIKEGIMNFYFIESWDDVQTGFYNIREPITNEMARLDSDTLVIMPGLAFDLHKHRIGYGGGYYDKYLIGKKPLAKLALAYDFQVFESIPYESTDVDVDGIITEERAIF
jgi:5-formyltetrahydrofolate cyclo-ligase